MAMTDNAVLIEGLKNLVDGATLILACLRQTIIPEGGNRDVSAEAPAKAYTYEEARAVLAEKARAGFRAEVKAILTRHGVAQLSDVKDPKELAGIVEETSALECGE